MEVAGHMFFTIAYANVYALANELATIENPTNDQRRHKVILESTALQMQAARGRPPLPTLLKGQILAPLPILDRVTHTEYRPTRI
jgi:hypothetical protein